MSAIKAVKINSIVFENQIDIVPPWARQLIIDEFYNQLQNAIDLLGAPAFRRKVKINVTSKNRFFNSKDNLLVFEKWCIDWDKHLINWNLSEALSHETVHLIIGNTPRRPYKALATVMEEGLAYYNTVRLLTYINYDGRNNVVSAINCVKEALIEVPSLLDIWRSPSGKAPVIQKLKVADLQNCGLSTDISQRLLADFV